MQHIEQQFSGSETVRDAVIGMADGLSVGAVLNTFTGFLHILAEPVGCIAADDVNGRSPVRSSRTAMRLVDVIMIFGVLGERAFLLLMRCIGILIGVFHSNPIRLIVALEKG